MVLDDRGEGQLGQCFRNSYDCFQLPAKKNPKGQSPPIKTKTIPLVSFTARLSESNFSRRCPVPPAVLASSTPQSGCSAFLAPQVTAGVRIFYRRQDTLSVNQHTCLRSHVRFAICDITFHLIQIYLPFSIARLPTRVWSVHM